MKIAFPFSCKVFPHFASALKNIFLSETKNRSRILHFINSQFNS